MKKSYTFNNIEWVFLSIFLSFLIGIAFSIINFKIVLLVIFVSFILIVLFIKRLFFDFLLLSSICIFIFAQFELPYIDLGRFASIFFMACLSAYVIKNKKIPKNKILVGLSYIAGYSLMTSFFSYYPTVAMSKSITLFLLVGFLLFVPPAIKIIHPQIETKEYMQRLFMMIAIVFTISNAIYYLLFPSSSNGYYTGTAFLNGRFRGWFVNPNDLATLLGVFFVPILWSKFRNETIRFNKLILFILSIITIIELLGTQSRAGILSGFISLLILELGIKNWKTRIPFIAILIFLAVGVYLVNPEDNIFRQFIYRNEIELAGSGRLDYWKSAIIRFFQAPIFGSGLGVSITYPKINLEGLVFNSQGFTLQKDNSYITALEELGVVGCLILGITLLLPLCRAFWKELIKTKKTFIETNLISASIVVAGLFNAIFESWLLSVGNIACISFWIFAFILMEDNSKYVANN